MSAQGAWAGGRVGPLARCVLAPNPGPMTLDGTNTWVLGAPGAGRAVVVDPGPDDEGHLDGVLRVADREHGGVALVLLTHHHLDHSAGAHRLAERAEQAQPGAGVPVRAVDAALLRAPTGGPAPSPLVDDEEVAVPGGRLRVLLTPGHTGDSACFVLEHHDPRRVTSDPASGPGPGRASGPGPGRASGRGPGPASGPVPVAGASVLTGDTVLGRGTSVVAHPDGDLVAYLDSLGRLVDEVGALRAPLLLPGHGPVREDALGVVDGYVTHRRERLAQVRAAVAGGARTPEEVVATVYPGLAEDLVPPALRSTAAALQALSRRG